MELNVGCRNGLECLILHGLVAEMFHVGVHGKEDERCPDLFEDKKCPDCPGCPDMFEDKKRRPDFAGCPDRFEDKRCPDSVGSKVCPDWRCRDSVDEDE